jgi:hypothetical protein
VEQYVEGQRSLRRNNKRHEVGLKGRRNKPHIFHIKQQAHLCIWARPDARYLPGLGDSTGLRGQSLVDESEKILSSDRQRVCRVLVHFDDIYHSRRLCQ